MRFIPGFKTMCEVQRRLHSHGEGRFPLDVTLGRRGVRPLTHPETKQKKRQKEENQELPTASRGMKRGFPHAVACAVKQHGNTLSPPPPPHRPRCSSPAPWSGVLTVEGQVQKNKERWFVLSDAARRQITFKERLLRQKRSAASFYSAPPFPAPPKINFKLEGGARSYLKFDSTKDRLERQRCSSPEQSLSDKLSAGGEEFK